MIKVSKFTKFFSPICIAHAATLMVWFYRPRVYQKYNIAAKEDHFALASFIVKLCHKHA